MKFKKGTIKYIHDLLVSKEISCCELTKKYFSEIEKSKLNAYVNLCKDSALELAEQIDKKISGDTGISMLEGIPMLLKDNISTNGIETTCCSNILKSYVPIYDATVWSLLKRENSVLLGKGNMDEFAMGSTCETSCFGGAKNPHNTAYVAGGSSGGVAAAVGGNIAVYGLGSDTGGSIRQPASFCGVVGLKPTYGAVSRYGVIAYASSFDQVGPITKTVEDAAIVFDVISRHDSRDSTSSRKAGENATLPGINNSIEGVKIGIPEEYFDGVEGEIHKAIDAAINVYKSLGAQIEYFNLPELKYSLPVYYILACAEASSNLGRYDGIRYGYKAEKYRDINDMICKTRAEGFGKEVKRRIMLGTYVLSAGYYDAYYKKAQNLRGKIIEAFKTAFKRFDVILAPTAATTAFRSEANLSSVEMYLTDIYTVPVNIAGLPAISIPCAVHSNGLPIGMQLIGDSFSEGKLLNIANLYESETEGQFLSKTDGMGVRI